MNHPPDNEKADAGLQPDAGSENQLRAGLAHNANAMVADTTDNPQLTKKEAEFLTRRIQGRLELIADKTEELLPLIAEAQTGGAHHALGYRSWPEFVAEKFGGALARLTKVERLPFVELLADQGMSTRAIASVVGASKSQVARDISTVPNGTPAEVPPAVTGTDGKTYTRPEIKPRRRPLPDAYRDAAYDLDKAVARLARLHADDRFQANREFLHQRHGVTVATINTAMETLTDELLGIDDQIGGE